MPITIIEPHDSVACGELQGSLTAAQMPSLACTYVYLKAVSTNTGKVYVGGPGVTKADGTTDTTTGLELSAGDVFGPIPISNLNILWYITDNAGDDLTYVALV